MRDRYSHVYSNLKMTYRLHDSASNDIGRGGTYHYVRSRKGVGACVLTNE